MIILTVRTCVILSVWIEWHRIVQSEYLFHRLHIAKEYQDGVCENFGAKLATVMTKQHHDVILEKIKGYHSHRFTRYSKQ